MRYVVQIRRSVNLGGQHFVLRVYPEFRPDERRWESFTSPERLVERMTDLGVPGMKNAARTFSGGGVLDAVWTNVEVPDQMLENFGKGAGYQPVAA